MMDKDVIEARLTDIKQREEVVAKAEALWKERKEEAKDAKEDYDLAIDVLRQTIQQELPLLESK